MLFTEKNRVSGSMDGVSNHSQGCKIFVVVVVIVIVIVIQAVFSLSSLLQNTFSTNVRQRFNDNERGSLLSHRT